MKQLQKIRGMSQQQLAHFSIVSTASRYDEQQGTENLIAKCMKSLIRQKMSGCLINIKRKKSQSPNIDNSYLKNYIQIEHYLNRAIQKKNINSQNPQKQSSDQLKTKRTRRYNSSTISNNRKIIEDQSTSYLNSRTVVHSIEPNTLNEKKCTKESCINGTDQKEKDKFVPFSQLSNQANFKKQKDKVLQLPLLNMIGKNKLQVTKCSIKRGESPISSDLWKFLTGDKNKKIKKNKTSNSVTEACSLNSSIPLKEQKKIICKSVPSSKQKFIDYVHYLPSSFRRLLELILSFLEVKLPTQLSYQSYVAIGEEILSIGERVWSVIAFLFWDVSRDGIINSKDVFSVFKEFNNFGDKCQNYTSENQKEVRKKGQELQKSIETKKLQKQQAIMKLENVQRALHLFKKEIERVNNFIHQNTSTHEIDFFDDNIPLNYLQQAVLTSPNLKCKQVAVLIGVENSKRENSMNKINQKFQTPINQLYSSSQKRPMFLGKANCQEIKKSKDKLQQLKGELKQKRKARLYESQYRSKNYLPINNQITYAQLIQNQMGYTIREVTSNLLGFLA